jgi:nitrogen fixation protein NifB
VRFQGVRKIDHYCLDGAGDEEALKGAISALEGVSAVLCAKIGRCPREALEAAGMEVSQAEAQEWIEAGVATWYEGRYGTTVRRRA